MSSRAPEGNVFPMLKSGDLVLRSCTYVFKTWCVIKTRDNFERDKILRIRKGNRERKEEEWK
jgi:hypothetical protein